MHAPNIAKTAGLHCNVMQRKTTPIFSTTTNLYHKLVKVELYRKDQTQPSHFKALHGYVKSGSWFWSRKVLARRQNETNEGDVEVVVFISLKVSHASLVTSTVQGSGVGVGVGRGGSQSGERMWETGYRWSWKRGLITPRQLYKENCVSVVRW